MEIEGDIALTKLNLKEFKQDLVKTKKDIGNGTDKALAKIINSKVFTKIHAPQMYNKERKQQMKDLLRIVELMKTYPRHSDGAYEIPGTYIDDILKRLKNIDGTI